MFKYLFILTTVTICSCNSIIYQNFNYSQSKKPWINAFKDRVFISSLTEAYKSDTTIFQQIIKKDALNPFDGLTLYEIQKADELGRRLIENIPPPAMCEGCTAGMNYYMAVSLHYYNSKELDVIAKNLYKQHSK